MLVPLKIFGWRTNIKKIICHVFHKMLNFEDSSLKAGVLEIISFEKITRKVLPLPNSLSISSLPLCLSTMCFTKAKPKPVLLNSSPEIRCRDSSTL